MKHKYNDGKSNPIFSSEDAKKVFTIRQAELISKNIVLLDRDKRLKPKSKNINIHFDKVLS
jgi:hypothetical protein